MDNSAKTALESALREFEPLFWVGPWGESLDRIYEPDGTLYAICLEGPTYLTTDRRKLKVETGDLVIIPPAVALDSSDPARWFGLVYTGPYPYHFRERFIQVWGFEHVALSHLKNQIQPADLRHRIYISNAGPDDANQPISSEFHLRLTLDTASTEPAITWAAPGQSLPPVASQHAIDFRIPLEAIYLTHREARPQPNPTQTLSPEFRPDSNPA